MTDGLHAYGSGLGADSCNYVLFGVIRNKQVKNFARNIGPCDSCYDQLPSGPISCSDLHLVSCVSQDFAMLGEIERPRNKPTCGNYFNCLLALVDNGFKNFRFDMQRGCRKKNPESSGI